MALRISSTRSTRARFNQLSSTPYRSGFNQDVSSLLRTPAVRAGRVAVTLPNQHLPKPAYNYDSHHGDDGHHGDAIPHVHHEPHYSGKIPSGELPSGKYFHTLPAVAPSFPSIIRRDK